MDDVKLMLTMLVGAALRTGDRVAYMREAVMHLPLMAPSLFDPDLPQEELEGRVRWWAGVVWDQLPLPWNGYRPQPAPKPGRNDPCPCGSGRKYKQCCQRFAADAPLPPLSALLWGVLLETVERKERKRLLSEAEVPPDVVGVMAQTALDEGRPKAVLELVGPLFEHRLDQLGDAGPPLLTLFCDACDQHYRTDRNKLALLDRAVASHDRFLRGEAYQRLATIFIDKGEVEAAWDYFREAQRATPNDPSHALLEVMLLGSRGQWQQAKERARFWLARIRRLRDPALADAEALLEQAARDPAAALSGVTLQSAPQVLQRLSDWIQSATQRPVKALPVEIIEGDPDGGILSAPPALAAIEKRWHELFPADKPFSVGWEPMDGDPWDDPEPWVEFLERHPQAADSLDILDDIQTALFLHAESDFGWTRQTVMRPLLLRGEAILRASVGEPPTPLPWLVPENRPGLRLVSHLITLDLHADNAADAAERMAWLLAINPNDNHGWRYELVNHLLKQRDAVAALALCDRYPNDAATDLFYGRALALFMLGNTDAAAEALDEAAQFSPKVIKALQRERMRQPATDPRGVLMGGDDEAWLYREAMRETWLSNPLAKQFLRGMRVSGGRKQ